MSPHLLSASRRSHLQKYGPYSFHSDGIDPQLLEGKTQAEIDQIRTDQLIFRGKMESYFGVDDVVKKIDPAPWTLAYHRSDPSMLINSFGKAETEKLLQRLLQPEKDRPQPQPQPSLPAETHARTTSFVGKNDVSIQRIHQVLTGPFAHILLSTLLCQSILLSSDGVIVSQLTQLYDNYPLNIGPATRFSFQPRGFRALNQTMSSNDVEVMRYAIQYSLNDNASLDKIPPQIIPHIQQLSRDFRLDTPQGHSTLPDRYAYINTMHPELHPFIHLYDHTKEPLSPDRAKSFISPISFDQMKGNPYYERLYEAILRTYPTQLYPPFVSPNFIKPSTQTTKNHSLLPKLDPTAADSAKTSSSTSNSNNKLTDTEPNPNVVSAYSSASPTEQMDGKLVTQQPFISGPNFMVVAMASALELSVLPLFKTTKLFSVLLEDRSPFSWGDYDTDNYQVFFQKMKELESALIPHIDPFRLVDDDFHLKLRDIIHHQNSLFPDPLGGAGDSDLDGLDDGEVDDVSNQAGNNGGANANVGAKRQTDMKKNATTANSSKTARNSKKDASKSDKNNTRSDKNGKKDDSKQQQQQQNQQNQQYRKTEPPEGLNFADFVYQFNTMCLETYQKYILPSYMDLMRRFSAHFERYMLPLDLIYFVIQRLPHSVSPSPTIPDLPPISGHPQAAPLTYKSIPLYVQQSVDLTVSLRSDANIKHTFCPCCLQPICIDHLQSIYDFDRGFLLRWLITFCGNDPSVCINIQNPRSILHNHPVLRYTFYLPTLTRYRFCLGFNQFFSSPMSLLIRQITQPFSSYYNPILRSKSLQYDHIHLLAKHYHTVRSICEPTVVPLLNYRPVIYIGNYSEKPHPFDRSLVQHVFLTYILTSLTPDLFMYPPATLPPTAKVTLNDFIDDQKRMYPLHELFQRDLAHERLNYQREYAKKHPNSPIPDPKLAPPIIAQALDIFSTTHRGTNHFFTFVTSERTRSDPKAALRVIYRRYLSAVETAKKHSSASNQTVSYSDMLNAFFADKITNPNEASAADECLWAYFEMFTIYYAFSMLFYIPAVAYYVILHGFWQPQYLEQFANWHQAILATIAEDQRRIELSQKSATSTTAEKGSNTAPTSTITTAADKKGTNVPKGHNAGGAKSVQNTTQKGASNPTATPNTQTNAQNTPNAKNDPFPSFEAFLSLWVSVIHYSASCSIHREVFPDPSRPQSLNSSFYLLQPAPLQTIYHIHMRYPTNLAFSTQNQNQNQSNNMQPFPNKQTPAQTAAAANAKGGKMQGNAGKGTHSQMQTGGQNNSKLFPSAKSNLATNYSATHGQAGNTNLDSLYADSSMMSRMSQGLDEANCGDLSAIFSQRFLQQPSMTNYPPLVLQTVLLTRAQHQTQLAPLHSILLALNRIVKLSLPASKLPPLMLKSRDNKDDGGRNDHKTEKASSNADKATDKTTVNTAITTAAATTTASVPFDRDSSPIIYTPHLSLENFPFIDEPTLRHETVTLLTRYPFLTQHTFQSSPTTAWKNPLILYPLSKTTISCLVEARLAEAEKQLQKTLSPGYASFLALPNRPEIFSIHLIHSKFQTITASSHDNNNNNNNNKTTTTVDSKKTTTALPSYVPLPSKKTLLMAAFALGAPPRVIKSLLELGANNLTQSDENGFTPVRWGVERVIQGASRCLKLFGFPPSMSCIFFSSMDSTNTMYSATTLPRQLDSSSNLTPHGTSPLSIHHMTATASASLNHFTTMSLSTKSSIFAQSRYNFTTPRLDFTYIPGGSVIASPTVSPQTKSANASITPCKLCIATERINTKTSTLSGTHPCPACAKLHGPQHISFSPDPHRDIEFSLLMAQLDVVNNYLRSSFSAGKPLTTGGPKKTPSQNSQDVNKDYAVDVSKHVLKGNGAFCTTTNALSGVWNNNFNSTIPSDMYASILHDEWYVHAASAAYLLPPLAAKLTLEKLLPVYIKDPSVTLAEKTAQNAHYVLSTAPATQQFNVQLFKFIHDPATHPLLSHTPLNITQQVQSNLVDVKRTNTGKNATKKDNKDQKVTQTSELVTFPKTIQLPDRDLARYKPSPFIVCGHYPSPIWPAATDFGSNFVKVAQQLITASRLQTESALSTLQSESQTDQSQVDVLKRKIAHIQSNIKSQQGQCQNVQSLVQKNQDLLTSHSASRISMSAEHAQILEDITAVKEVIVFNRGDVDGICALIDSHLSSGSTKPLMMDTLKHKFYPPPAQIQAEIDAVLKERQLEEEEEKRIADEAAKLQRAKFLIISPSSVFNYNIDQVLSDLNSDNNGTSPTNDNRLKDASQPISSLILSPSSPNAMSSGELHKITPTSASEHISVDDAKSSSSSSSSYTTTANSNAVKFTHLPNTQSLIQSQSQHTHHYSTPPLSLHPSSSPRQHQQQLTALPSLYKALYQFDYSTVMRADSLFNYSDQIHHIHQAHNLMPQSLPPQQPPHIIHQASTIDRKYLLSIIAQDDNTHNSANTNANPANNFAQPQLSSLITPSQQLLTFEQFYSLLPQSPYNPLPRITPNPATMYRFSEDQNQQLMMFFSQNAHVFGNNFTTFLKTTTFKRNFALLNTLKRIALLENRLATLYLTMHTLADSFKAIIDQYQHFLPQTKITFNPAVAQDGSKNINMNVQNVQNSDLFAAQCVTHPSNTMTGGATMTGGGMIDPYGTSSPYQSQFMLPSQFDQNDLSMPSMSGHGGYFTTDLNANPMLAANNMNNMNSSLNGGISPTNINNMLTTTPHLHNNMNNMTGLNPYGDFYPPFSPFPDPMNPTASPSNPFQPSLDQSGASFHSQQPPPPPNHGLSTPITTTSHLQQQYDPYGFVLPNTSSTPTPSPHQLTQPQFSQQTSANAGGYYGQFDQFVPSQTRSSNSSFSSTTQMHPHPIQAQTGQNGVFDANTGLFGVGVGVGGMSQLYGNPMLSPSPAPSSINSLSTPHLTHMHSQQGQSTTASQTATELDPAKALCKTCYFYTRTHITTCCWTLAVCDQCVSNIHTLCPFCAAPSPVLRKVRFHCDSELQDEK